MNAETLTIDVPLEQVLTTLAPLIETHVNKRLTTIDAAILAVTKAADRAQSSKNTRDENSSVKALVSASLDLKRARSVFVKALKSEGKPL
jgi:hypothetical protein